jgi:hypothetical protein
MMYDINKLAEKKSPKGKKPPFFLKKTPFAVAFRPLTSLWGNKNGINWAVNFPMPHPKEDRNPRAGVDMVKGGGRSTPKTRKCRDCDHQPAQKVIWARCPVCHGVMRVVRYD